MLGFDPSAGTLVFRTTGSGPVVTLPFSRFSRLTLTVPLQRAATLICAMEIIRKEMPAVLGTWPFEVGLWVGKAATPNRMGKRGETDRTTARFLPPLDHNAKIAA